MQPTCYRIISLRTINAGPNSKYFGAGRGITYYSFTSDQFTGFHAIVIPGTLRDSLFILEGLLEQQGTISTSELIGSLLGSSRPSTLTRAIGELGRVAKTLTYCPTSTTRPTAVASSRI